MGSSATPRAKWQYRRRSKNFHLTPRVVVLDTELDSDIRRHPQLGDKIIAVGLKPLLCGSVVIFVEWEQGERVMLLRALKYLERCEAEAGHLVLIGWNLIFDTNQVIARGMVHGLLEELDILRRAYKVDLMQIILPFNGWRYAKGSEVARLLGIEIPHKNVNIPRLYHEGHYDEVVKHLKADLDFEEELYLRLRKNWPWTMDDLLPVLLQEEEQPYMDRDEAIRCRRHRNKRRAS